MVRITFAGQRVTQQSTLSFAEDYRVAAGAAVVTHERADAAEMLAEYALGADACTRLQERSSKHSFEPLAGLDDGAVGWRTVDDSVEYDDGTTGRWGEFALVPLDDTHLLAVGFATVDDDPPVDLDELIRIARERAEGMVDDD